MVRFLVKGPLRLLDSGGDMTVGLGEDGDGGDGDVVAGEACVGVHGGFGGADAEAGEVAPGEACEGAGDGFGATNAKAEAELSERLPSSSGAAGGVARMPLLIGGADCGEDWAWAAT